MPLRPLHLVLNFDDNYWAPAYATMRSVCLYTSRCDDLHFHLLHGRLTDGHRDILDWITAEFGAPISYYDLTDDALLATMPPRPNHRHRLPNIVHGRILVAELLPLHVERALYIDCDMLVRVPIERLIESDMGGKPLAAVPDYLGAQIIASTDMIDRRGLFEVWMRYFNAGLLLIDVAAWRTMRLAERLAESVADGTLARLNFDQDFLNIAFRDNWLELDRNWNFLDPRPLHETLNPNILHYTGRKKPWGIRAPVAFARLYRRVMTRRVYFRYLHERAPSWQRPLIRYFAKGALDAQGPVRTLKAPPK